MESSRYILRSRLEESFRDELDQLFFFNPRQFKVKEQVVQIAGRYGPPEIQKSGSFISIGIRNFEGAQALFVLSRKAKARLLGGFVFIREGDRLVVLYVALKAAQTTNWQKSCALLSFVTQTLRHIGGQIAGVNRLEFRVGAKPVIMKLR